MDNKPPFSDEEVLKLVQARLDGKTIERSSIVSEYWSVMDPRQLWDFTEWKYRIQKLEVWVNVYPGGDVSVYPTRNEAIDDFLPGVLRTAVHMIETP